MQRYFKSNDFVAYTILISCGLCFLAAFSSIGYLIFKMHMTEKLYKVVLYNSNYWILSFLGVVYAVWRKIKNPINFDWKEFVVQTVGGFIILFGLSSAFLLISTDLHDTEVWNGKVMKGEYYEEWTELVHYTEEQCTGSGENRNCVTVHKTRHDYHPPYWVLTTSNGEEVSINKSNFNNIKDHFGNAKKINIFRANQVSFGDGNKFETNWNQQGSTILPSAVEHDFVNYLAASKSITKRQGVSDEFTQFLVHYPRVFEGRFGEIEINRVIQAGTNIPNEWKNQLDKTLDISLSHLGKSKQVNCLVYTVNTSDPKFLHALEQHWCYGKKNDVVVVLGIEEFPKISWAGCMVFAGNEELKVKLRDNLLALTDLQNATEVGEIITKSIQAHYHRIPMEKLDYLLYDIEMPFWAIICLIFIFAVNILAINYYFENN